MDLASEAVGMGIKFGVGYLFSSSDKRKTEEVVNQLKALSDAQQAELKAKLDAVKQENEKTKILFDYLNEIKQKNREKQLKNKRIVMGAFLGIAAIGVVLVFLKLKSKK